SEIPEIGDEYAATVAGWMTEQPERLAAFHDYAAAFEHRKVEPELVHLLRLFQARIGDEEHLSGAQLIDAVEFALPHVGASARELLIIPAARAAELSARSGSSAQVAAMLGLLAQAVRDGGTKADSTRFVDAWYRCFDAMRTDARWSLLSVLEQSRDK